MSSRLYDPAFFEDQYLVSFAHGGETMGNDEGGLTAHQFFERSGDDLFGGSIKGGGGLV